jgi:hypothetical protein
MCVCTDFGRRGSFWSFTGIIAPRECSWQFDHREPKSARLGLPGCLILASVSDYRSHPLLFAAKLGGFILGCQLIAETLFMRNGAGRKRRKKRPGRTRWRQAIDAAILTEFLSATDVNASGIPRGLRASRRLYEKRDSVALRATIHTTPQKSGSGPLRCWRDFSVAHEPRSRFRAKRRRAIADTSSSRKPGSDYLLIGSPHTVEGAARACGGGVVGRTDA